MVERTPIKIDIGGVYTEQVRRAEEAAIVKFVHNIIDVAKGL